MDNNNKNTKNNNNNKVVLDSSALMALFNNEEGAETVYMLLPQAVLSTVTLCKVISLAVEQGISPALLFNQIERLELKVVPFDAEQAKTAVHLITEYQNEKLCFDHRAALALALRLNLPLYTAEKEMAKLSSAIAIHLIR